MVRNGRKRPVDRQVNVLVPSSRDVQVFGYAINEKFLEVCELHKRERGIELPVPESLQLDLIRWRIMFNRHNKQGDPRHTEAELRSSETVAQWTLDVNCDLRNQERKVLTFEWGQ